MFLDETQEVSTFMADSVMFGILNNTAIVLLSQDQDRQNNSSYRYELQYCNLGWKYVGEFPLEVNEDNFQTESNVSLFHIFQFLLASTL